MVFGKLVNKLVLVANFFFAAALLISGISVFISPAHYWVFAFFSLSFSYLLIINFIFIAFWLLQLSRWSLLSACCIMLNLGHITAIWQSPSWFLDFFNDKPKKAKIVKILSYNIKAMNRYESKKPLLSFNAVLKELKQHDPDIMCFQEFHLHRKGNENINQIIRNLKPAKYYYTFFNYSIESTEGDGLIIFSKYPILNKHKFDFKNSGNAAMYADVNINGQYTRIFSVHLQSLKFMKDNYDYLDTLSLSYDAKNKKELKKISVKLRDAFILRAEQAEDLSGYIKQSPYPVIVCGDFNDTPVSYSYRIMKANLKDAFRESGHGLGKTYNGLAPSFRIDYILFSKVFESTFFETIRINYSDHFPIFTKIYLKN